MPDLKRALKTTDVPPEFLEAAFVVGHVPQMALQSDLRVSYSLYVPPQPYKTASTADAGDRTKLPILVNVHGTRRNLGAIYGDLKTFADSMPCAVMQPLFPAGIEGPNDLDSYKYLKSETFRSDLALISMLQEVETRWHYIDTMKIYLMGFSGGGQFVQRFLLLYPERLVAVSIGAPGKLTSIEKDQRWPKGIQDIQEIFGRSIDMISIKAVKIHMVVGNEDTGVHGGNDFVKWQMSMKTKMTGLTDGGIAFTDNIDSEKSKEGRLAALQHMHRLWRDAGIESYLDIVDGVGHSAEGVRASVLQFFGSLLK